VLHSLKTAARGLPFWSRQEQLEPLYLLTDEAGMKAVGEVEGIHRKHCSV
jgi:hypothetical protein